jgi:Ig-like domain CHU_C associated
VNRFHPSAHARLLFSRLSSLLLLFQRTPMVQWLLPEVKIASSAGLGEITRWTAVAIAGLGSYDTVAGATVISQLAPQAGSATVTAPVNRPLSFVFRATGSQINPAIWTVTGTLPPGLVHSNVKDEPVDSITGIPTKIGNYRVKITSWAHSDFTGDSVSKTFTIQVTSASGTPPKITVQPMSVSIAAGKKATLRVKASRATTYQWYRGIAGVTKSPIRGATAASFTTPGIKATSNYWVRLTNAGGSTDSKTVTVKVAARRLTLDSER